MNKVCVCTCGVPTPSSIVTWMSATGLSKIKKHHLFLPSFGLWKAIFRPWFREPSLFVLSTLPLECGSAKLLPLLSVDWLTGVASGCPRPCPWLASNLQTGAVVSFSSRNLLAFVLRFVIYSLLQSCWWQVGKCWGEPKRNTKRTLTNGVRIWRCVRWRRYSVTGWNGLSFRPHTWRMGSWQAAQHSSTGSSWQSRLENCRWANVSDSVTAVYTQPPAFVDLRTTNEPGQLR